MSTFILDHSLGGKPINDGSCIYSWTYSLILVPPDHFLGSQGYEINQEVFGKKLDKFLQGLRPAYHWTGSANYRAYEERVGVLPRVLHLWPGKCYVQLRRGGGPRMIPQLVKCPTCSVQRLDEVGFAPGVRIMG